MARTLYQVGDGAPVVVHDAVDAKEYLATGRYTASPPEPLEVLLAPAAEVPAALAPSVPAEARSGPKKAV